MDSGLLRWQPFTVWGGPRMSLGGVPCVPLPPMTLVLRGLVARIQKRIFLGSPYAMGFDWQPCTLPSSMGGILDLRHLHPQAAPLFCHFGVLMGGLHSPPLLLLIIMGVVYGGGTFPQGHGGYPRAATLVVPSLAFVGSLLHPSLLQEDHHSSSGSDITMSFSSPG
jgi:hypothetical protein